MSDHTVPTLEDIQTIDEETSRRLFGEAIEEVIIQHGLSGDDADGLRMSAWAAYARIDMKMLGHQLKTGVITVADAVRVCLPVVAEVRSAGMQGKRQLH